MLGEIGGARTDAIYTFLLPAPCLVINIQSLISLENGGPSRAKENLSISALSTKKPSFCVRVTNRAPLKEASWGLRAWKPPLAGPQNLA